MRFIKTHILFLVILLTPVFGMAQFDPSGVTRVENGRLQFTLDTRWTDVQKKEIEKLFNLDSTLWVKLNLNTSTILLDSVNWEVKHVSKFLVELSKSIDKDPSLHLFDNDVFLIGVPNGIVPFPPGYVDMEKVFFGVNSYKKPQCFRYDKGKALFYLPGYQKNTKANIAGSFNNWDPLQTQMQKVDSGWIVSLPLVPGKYLYKYLVDGKWMTDPNNARDENDGTGNINSVVYCPDYTFHLQGYLKSRKVYVTGTFNNWDKKELRMVQDPQGWSLPAYLRDGTYSYKFIVDDEWLADPANPLTRTDADGNVNSVIGFGEKYVFHLKGYLSAGKVLLSGSFNNWDTKELVMQKTTDGWQIPFQLAPGNYEYKFIVDGKWMTDPANLFTSGSGDVTNSFMAFKSNYTFSVDKFQDSREVRLSGDFNGWNPEGYNMVKKDGKWVFPLYLSPGKHLYKLVVDGKWYTDPTNPLWDENEYGTGNSVLWVPGE